ncbi:MAG: type II secretion system F family protein [Pseudomonadota bacterium]
MSETNLILIVGVLAVLMVGGVLFAIFGGAFAEEARRSKRLATIDTKKNRANSIVSKRNKDQNDAASRIKDLVNKEKRKQGAFDIEAKLMQAGISMGPSSFMMIFYGLSGVSALGVLVSGQPPLFALLAALVVAFGLPRWFLAKAIARRQKRFIENFANAIDVLVRGVRSGLPVTEGLKVIAHEIPDPVKTEFQLLVDSSAVGVPIEDGLQKMHDRVSIPEVNFFRTVLVIQKSTGGNLAEALSNLSGILRDRKKLKGKIKALSSEAKMSAMIIGSLPFIVGMLVYLVKPDYIELLFIDPTGNMLIAGGLVWMLCGILMMAKMINFDI